MRSSAVSFADPTQKLCRGFTCSKRLFILALEMLIHNWTSSCRLRETSRHKTNPTQRRTRLFRHVANGERVANFPDPSARMRLELRLLSSRRAPAFPRDWIVINRNVTNFMKGTHAAACTGDERAHNEPSSRTSSKEFSNEQLSLRQR